MWFFLFFRLAGARECARPHASLDGMTPAGLLHAAALPLGSLTLADAPLIDAEILFR
jgi:hypothetical protein